MLQAKEICLSYGEQIIFDNVSFNINNDQKIGLVGRNGTGKTTLLKIIAAQHGFDSGILNIQKNIKIAYMPQEVVMLSDKKILFETLDAFELLSDLYFQFCVLENELNKSVDKHDEDMVNKFAQLQQKLLELNYEDKIKTTKKILAGLGFSNKDFDKTVDQLSVGWKMRLVLAKLLLQNADFYLFDEPTNHLDLVAKDWFLDFLKFAKFGYILVSHDRYFLDNVCDYIYEISLGKINIYRGNYTKYIEQKEKNQELQEKKYLEQQKFIKNQMRTIERFRAKASKAGMVQSKIKALEKIEMIQIEQKPKSVKFHFSNVERAGKIVLQVKDLAFSFDNKKIFDKVSFILEREQKIAIIAPNGTGKTTLLNVIMGKLEQQNGTVEFGFNVKPVFFQQDQTRSLDQNKTILEEVESCCQDSETRQKVRTFLGAFLFSGDDVLKNISVLSGGEKNRVAMVKVLLQNANFLILDEPTNHLDIQSKEILLNVLKQYTGTILFVSHDRTFLNELSTGILELTADGSYFYSGNYDSYIYQKQIQANLVKESNTTEIQKGISSNNNQINKSSKQNINNKDIYLLRKKLGSLENKIEKLEKEKKQLINKFNIVEYGTEQYYQVCSRLKIVDQELAENLKAWEEISANIA